MIIEEYDESLFIQRFENYERVGEGKNFSYEGLRALFSYLDEENDEENPYKLDVVGLCCDFSEYKDTEEFLKDYSNQEEEIKAYMCELEDNATEEEKTEALKQAIEDYLNDQTTLIKLDNDLDQGFIIGSY
jgi:hypothetical protein